MGDALNQPAFLAFYGLMQVNARMLDRVGGDLEARTKLPMSWLEILLCLEGEDAGKRMNALADELVISRGGVTRIIARMEEAGLVQRVTPPEDRRATYARLTDAGRDAAASATPVLLELVADGFGRHLELDELMELSRLSAKLLRGMDAECLWLEMAASAGVAGAAS